MTSKHAIYESIKNELEPLIEIMDNEYDSIHKHLESSENESEESFEKIIAARSTLNILKDKVPDILQSIADTKDKSTESSIKDELHQLIAEAVTAGQIVAELDLSETLKELILDMMTLGFASEIGLNTISFLEN